MREDAPRIIGLIFHSSGPLHFSCHIVLMENAGIGGAWLLHSTQFVDVLYTEICLIIPYTYKCLLL